MKTPQITQIYDTDCVGNSRITINNNFNSLSASIVDLYYNPAVAVPRGSIGAVRVSDGFNVQPDGTVNVSIDNKTIVFSENRLTINPSAIVGFLPLSGGVVTGPLTINGGLSIGTPLTTEFKLNVEGSLRVGGRMLIPNNGSISEIRAGTGNGATYDTYNTAIKVGGGLAFQALDNTVNTVIDTGSGNISTKGTLTTQSIVFGRNASDIQQTNPYLPLSFYTDSIERIRISKDGNVTIGKTENTNFKLDVGGTANFSGAVYTATPPLTDKSTRVATTEFVMNLRDQVGSNLDLYVKKTGDTMSGQLTVPNIICSTSASLNNVSIDGSTIVQASTNDAAVTVTQVGTGPSLEIKNGSGTTATITKEGDVNLKGSIIATCARVGSGSPSVSAGFKFTDNDKTGIFHEDQKLALYVNDTKVIDIGESETIVAGQIVLQGGEPTLDNHATTKFYVDHQLTQAAAVLEDQSSNTVTIDQAIALTGGTMKGNLTLAYDPTSDSDAVTKQYIDNKVGAINANDRVLRTGDTMTGALTIIAESDSDLTVQSSNGKSSLNIVSSTGATIDMRSTTSADPNLRIAADSTNATITTNNLKLSFGNATGSTLSVVCNNAEKITVDENLTTIKNSLVINNPTSGNTGSSFILKKPATNTSLSEDVTVDVYGNTLRFYERGSTFSGVYVDLKERSGTELVKLATEDFVNARFNSTIAANSNVAEKVNKRGDAMTGDLWLAKAPVDDGHAVRKDWADDETSKKIDRSGDVMTGFLSVPAPTEALHAANKSYVDDKINAITQGMTIPDSVFQLVDAFTVRVSRQPLNTTFKETDTPSTFPSLSAEARAVTLPFLDIAYQWQKNDVNIPGATTRILKLSSAGPTGPGIYKCIASNAISIVTTNAVVVDVIRKAYFIGQSNFVKLEDNSGAELSVNVGGTGPIYYVWRKHTTIGSTQTTVVETSATGRPQFKALTCGRYTCVVSNTLVSNLSSSSIYVNAPAVVNFTVSPASTPNNGIIQVSIDGGSGNFALTAEYVKPSTGNVTASYKKTALISSGNNCTFTGLTSATHNIIINDVLWQGTRTLAVRVPNIGASVISASSILLSGF